MSDHDWMQTPTLDDFAAMYDEDDNLWWRIDSGHHLNLYEAARERYEAAEAVIQAVRDVCAQAEGRVRDAGGYGPAAAVPIMDVRRALDGPQ